MEGNGDCCVMKVKAIRDPDIDLMSGILVTPIKLNTSGPINPTTITCQV